MTGTSTSIAKTYELVEETRKELLIELRRIENKVDTKYVSSAEYGGLKTRVKFLEKAVYGVAGFIIMSVIGALLALVVTQ